MSNLIYSGFLGSFAKRNRERHIHAGFYGQNSTFAPFVQTAIDTSGGDFSLLTSPMAPLYQDELTKDTWAFLYVGTGGDLTVTTPFGNDIQYKNLQGGKWYPMAITGVRQPVGVEAGTRQQVRLRLTHSDVITLAGTIIVTVTSSLFATQTITVNSLTTDTPETTTVNIANAIAFNIIIANFYLNNTSHSLTTDDVLTTAKVPVAEDPGLSISAVAGTAVGFTSVTSTETAYGLVPTGALNLVIGR